MFGEMPLTVKLKWDRICRVRGTNLEVDGSGKWRERKEYSVDGAIHCIGC